MPCDAGKYCETTGLISVTGPCDPGYYCLTRASRGNPSDGTTGNVCPMGHYCERGSPKPVVCGNGTYMNSTGIFHVCFLKAIFITIESFLRKSQKTFHTLLPQ